MSADWSDKEAGLGGFLERHRAEVVHIRQCLAQMNQNRRRGNEDRALDAPTIWTSLRGK